jgi:hypothetical protein
MTMHAEPAVAVPVADDYGETTHYALAKRVAELEADNASLRLQVRTLRAWARGQVDVRELDALERFERYGSDT